MSYFEVRAPSENLGEPSLNSFMSAVKRLVSTAVDTIISASSRCIYPIAAGYQTLDLALSILRPESAGRLGSNHQATSAL